MPDRSYCDTNNGDLDFNSSLDDSSIFNQSNISFQSEHGAGGPIVIGCQIYAKMDDNSDYLLAEVLNIQRRNGDDEAESYQYYIRYVGRNHRLDRWLDENMLDMSRIRYPEKTRKRSIRTCFKDWAQLSDLERSSIGHRPQKTVRIRNIHQIAYHDNVMIPWYWSPYPKFLSYSPCVYICTFCLHYHASQEQLLYHMECCQLECPPGDKIYEDIQNNIAVFEVDGQTESSYCENISLLSRLFLKDKNVVTRVRIFDYYVLCERTSSDVYHVVGYFSKVKFIAKAPKVQNNLACILVLPSHQKKGYGKFLIEFSYCLSKTEGKVGSPERPLSDLGLLSYRSYWKYAIIDAIFQQYPNEGSLESLQLGDIARLDYDRLAKSTGMTEKDIVETLENLKMIKCTEVGTTIVLSSNMAEEYFKAKQAWIHPKMENLKWTTRRKENNNDGIKKGLW